MAAVKTAKAIESQSRKCEWKEEQPNWKLIYNICMKGRWATPDIFESFCSEDLLRKINTAYFIIFGNKHLLPQHLLPIYYLDGSFILDQFYSYWHIDYNWFSLKECNVESLNLDRAIPYDDQAWTTIIEATLQNHNSHLTSIDFRGNYIITNNIKILANALTHPNCKLQLLSLDNCHIDNEGIKYISAALQHLNCKLISVNFGWNSIGEEGIESIAEALQHQNCQITSIGLRHCDISNKGAYTLATAISHPNCKLRYLDFYDNNIDIEGAKAIEAAIAYRRKMGHNIELIPNDLLAQTEKKVREQEKLAQEKQLKQELEAKAKALAAAQSASDLKVQPQVVTVSAAPQQSATLQQVSDGKASDIKTQSLASASSSQAIIVSMQAAAVTPPQPLSSDSKSQTETKADSKEPLPQAQTEAKAESKTSAASEQSAEDSSFLGSVWGTLGDFWRFITCRRKKPSPHVSVEQFNQLEQKSKEEKDALTKSIETIAGSIQQQDQRLLQGLQNCRTELSQVEEKVRKAKALAETKVSGQQGVIDTLTIREQARYAALRERNFICQDDKLGDFYFTFYHLLWENWLAYSAIHSNRIALSDDSTAMAVINGIGQQIPGVGMVTSLLDKLVKAARFPGQRTAINRVAAFFDPDNETGALVIEALARKLALAQREMIAKLATEKQGFFKRVGQSLERLKDRLTINDIDTRIKKTAAEQVEKLLSAIITGTLRPHPTLEDIETLFAAVLPEMPFPRVVPEIAEASDAKALSSSNASPATFSAVSSHAADSVMATGSLSINHSGSEVDASSSAALLSSLTEENRKLRASMAEQETRFAEWKHERELTFSEMLRKLDEESKKTHLVVEQVQAHITTVASTAEEAKKRAEAAAHLAEHAQTTVITAEEAAREAARKASQAQADVVTAINTAQNTHNEVSTLRQQAEQTSREAAQAKAKAEETRRALERSGIASDDSTMASGSSGTHGVYTQLFASTSQHPAHGLDPQVVALVRGCVHDEMAPMAQHIEERLENTAPKDQAQQPAFRKRKT